MIETGFALRRLVPFHAVTGACLILFGLAATSGGAAAQDDSGRGEKLVAELCGACHATGRGDASPHAAAPALRALDERLDLDAFVERLREGLQSPHADMPNFRFTRADARAVVAYLRSLQAR
ncbi:MAG: cytochrome c [Hyphomicrobiales bacterium]|nr:cytochrome c [Hyphomicrobiales bacterium]